MKWKKVLIYFFLTCNFVVIMSEEKQSATDNMVNPELKAVSREEISAWIDANFQNYFQKYNLSCEAAIVRMICGALGIRHLSEDDILKMFPLHKSNPDLGLVAADIDGDPFHPDGSINWLNYGVHAEVVQKVMERIFQENGLSGLYSLELSELDDTQLRARIKTDKQCLGVIIWVAAYIKGKKPPVNKIGQVLGEHVEYVVPILDAKERFVIYDVWPWPNQPFKMVHCLNRDLFKYRSIIINLKG